MISLSFFNILRTSGKGYWKFNSQFLHGYNYVEMVEKCITETILEYQISGNIADHENIVLSCNSQYFLKF